jgi:Cu2+-exporting ATPase
MTVTASASSAQSQSGAQSQTLFAIPGMHCAGCISKIENGLSQVPGITEARVNFTAKRVTIVHDWI